MAAVGPPPGVVGAQDVLQALQGAEHMQRSTSDAARQRFAHARRVLETIKHGLDDASTALALAEALRWWRCILALGPPPTYPPSDGPYQLEIKISNLETSPLMPSSPPGLQVDTADASYNESAPRGFIEHQGQLQTINDAQDHVALDECSLVRPAHIRRDGTNHHAHHSPGPPSPSRITASDDDRRQLSASQDGRSYDADGLA
ncbi:hypothetical protein GGG16DRAFT_111996 [Schizophyllum commune]